MVFIVCFCLLFSDVWNIKVLAYDEGRSIQSPVGDETVELQPNNINNNPPVFDPDTLEGMVMEHSAAGQSVLTVVATDLDSGSNGAVIYSIRRVPVKYGVPLFTLNPTTGLITTTMNNALDREGQSEFQIIVLARDQGTPEAKSASATVTIHIEDINDHAPRFPQHIYRATVSENSPVGSAILTVSASDADVGANAKMTYTLKEQDRQFFDITSEDDSNTGVLKLLQPLDYDTMDNRFFNLTVYVRDPDADHVDMAYIEVSVIDYNDNAPQFIPNINIVSIPETAEVGTALARFSATDKDSGANKQFIYAIDRNRDPMHQFSVESSGQVRLSGALDRETTPIHRVHILAIDTGVPAQTGTGTLIVSLSDVNDNYPVFAENYMPVITGNEAEGQTVATISAIDRDTFSNGPPFTFRLPCGGGCPCPQNPTCNDFSLEFIPGGGSSGHGSGIITTKRPFHCDEEKFYHMPIIMEDSGNPPVSGTSTLTIVIGNSCRDD